MSWVPDELQLCHGAVFRMMHQFKSEGEKYRYFIILNQNPRTDKLVVLTTTTTQRERLERLYGSHAESNLVYIHQSDYPDIEQFCVVDCQAIIPQEKNELLARMKQRGCEFKAPLPDNLIQKIVSSIANSKTIPSSLKSLIIDLPE